jgi:hydroxymethylpyrimidine pyrophosphatase-like HAD family hydrolase
MGGHAHGDGLEPPDPAAPALHRIAHSQLRSELRRRPACFATFDQQLEDLQRLARRLASDVHDHGPLLVVGLRTSGSYLAPLCASFLRSLGYRDIEWTTLRPGQRLGRPERDMVARLASAQGHAVIVDDPPRTGAQVLKTAEHLEELGVPRTRIRPMLALFPDSARVEERLRPYSPVLLRWSEWRVRSRLRPAELRQTLGTLLAAHSIPDASTPLQVARATEVRAIHSVTVTPPARGHISARIELTVADDNGRSLSMRVFAEGVGAGYFARHTVATANRLREFAPAVYGTHGGLMFREWLNDRARVTPRLAEERGDELATGFARYVAARRRSVAISRDLSLRLSGEAVWEELALMLARIFPAPGAGYLAARPVARMTARRLLNVGGLALIDGYMRLDNWFVGGTAPARALLKARTWRGVYSDKGLHSSDPAVDLAAAAAELERVDLPHVGSKLREMFERETSSSVDEERWLLYRLLDHLIQYEVSLRRAAAGDYQRRAFERVLTLERVMARVYRGYIERCFFADLTPLDDGPICAIDIDGVLEDRWINFPAASPAAALALRALNRHGCRAVVATGRSLCEVRERCATYRLAGGVAEYGAALYDHRSERQWSLLSEADREHLNALRDWLRAQPRVYLDPEHGHAVRAHTIDASGRRGGLGSELVAAALAAVPPGSVRAVPGALQSDFVPVGIDKGKGLRALATNIGTSHSEARPVAMAVGDTDADLPMFAVAERAFAPGNATSAAAASATRLRQAHASGLLAAVAAFLDHAPVRCASCRPPPLESSETALLLEWLALLNGDRIGKVRSLLAVAKQIAQEETAHRLRRRREAGARDSARAVNA